MDNNKVILVAGTKDKIIGLSLGENKPISIVAQSIPVMALNTIESIKDEKKRRNYWDSPKFQFKSKRR